MPRPNQQSEVLPSLLDRLIDTEPDVSSEPAWQRSQGLRQFKESVRRDLEYLFNTRSPPAESRFQGEHTSHSIYNFGLPDVTNVTATHPEDQAWLCGLVAEAIRTYEPRLTNLRVTLREPKDGNLRELWLAIEADLLVDPYPEAVVFDTVVEPTSGRCRIQESR
jgi:type VI secretion system protein ImpF